ncbi:MAG: metal-sensitive transcriptional regulator [Acidobacteriota bacterium]|nr:metal-sensitive transcriptional regulator [Acidobacteriota bacterium]
MDVDTKAELTKRLRRAEGQVAAVRRMLEDDEGCVDVLLQISAVRGALSKAGQVLLESHIETCVSEAFASGDPAAGRQRVAELMEIFGRFGGLAAK